MYIKAHCPVCNSEIYHNLRLEVLKYMSFEGHKTTCRYTVENIDITDTLTEEELAKEILQNLHNIIHDGIEIEVLAETLKENYGVTGACCRELIERIKIELDMYCPDMKTLHFVEPNCC